MVELSPESRVAQAQSTDECSASPRISDRESPEAGNPSEAIADSIRESIRFSIRTRVRIDSNQRYWDSSQRIGGYPDPLSRKTITQRICRATRPSTRSRFG